MSLAVLTASHPSPSSPSAMESPTSSRSSTPEQPPSLCQSSSMVSKFDFANLSGTQVLVSLRIQVLTYLADVEARLSQLESPISAESMKIKGESTVEEARACVSTALDMLNHIRDDVCSHLPDTHTMSESVGQFVMSHMPDVPQCYSLDDVRAHTPTIPTLRSRLPSISVHDMRARIDHVRSSISEIDFHRPLDYIPTLSEHLQSLQKHLLSMDLPHTFSDSLTKIAQSTAPVHDLIDRILSSEMAADIREGEGMIEKTAIELTRAIKASLNGSKLISYSDEPPSRPHHPMVPLKRRSQNACRMAEGISPNSN